MKSIPYPKELKRQVPYMKHELLTLPEHLS